MVPAVDELPIWQPGALNTIEVLKSLDEDSNWDIYVPQDNLLVNVF